MPTVTWRQLAGRQRLPGALALQLEELGQPPHDGQDHHQRVLGDGLAEDAAGVGDGEVAAGGLGRQQALDAGRRRVHPGEPGAAGQEAIEAGRGHGTAQQDLDVVERAVREALERDAHESGAGGGGTDARQVLLAIARRQDGRQRDGGWLAAVVAWLASPPLPAGIMLPPARVATQAAGSSSSRSRGQGLRPVPQVGDGRRAPGRVDAGHEPLAAPVLLQLEVHARETREDRGRWHVDAGRAAPRSAGGWRPRPAGPRRRPRP